MLFSLVGLAATYLHEYSEESLIEYESQAREIVFYGDDTDEAVEASNESEEPELNNDVAAELLGFEPVESVVSLNTPNTTVNFPGVSEVRVSVFVNGVWINVDDNTDSAEIYIPEDTQVTVRATKMHGTVAAMSYTFDSVVWYSGMVLNVPISTIIVSGISSAANVGISQGTWVYTQTPANVGVPNEFNVFDNDQAYNVVIGRTGFHNVIIGNVFAGNHINVATLFYNIEIPAGVTNVRIANANWVDNTVWQSIWTTEGQQPSHVDVITLLRNETAAWLLFDFCCLSNIRIDFYLDGTNPFFPFDLVCDCYVYEPAVHDINIYFFPGINGTGDMATVTWPAGTAFTLPENGFTAPYGYEFYAWFVEGYSDPGGTQHPGDVNIVGLIEWPNTNVHVTALWVPIEEVEELIPLYINVFVSYLLAPEDPYAEWDAAWTLSPNATDWWGPARHYGPFSAYQDLPFNYLVTGNRDKNVAFPESQNTYEFLGWMAIASTELLQLALVDFDPDTGWYIGDLLVGKNDMDLNGAFTILSLAERIAALDEVNENMDLTISLVALWGIKEAGAQAPTPTPPAPPPAAGQQAGALPATGVEGGNIVLWSVLLALAAMGITSSVIMITKVDLKSVAKKLNIKQLY